MENSLSIYGINGPLVTVKGKTDLKMSEMVYVGKEKLVGEVIRLRSWRRFRYLKRRPV